MDGAFTLRRYRPGDLKAIFALDERCFTEAFRFDERSMRRFAEARSALVLLAEGAEGTLAGFVVVHVQGNADGKTGYVLTLDVAPEQRRSGVASHLMAAVELLVSEAGAAQMGLHVHVENDGAIRFYEARGYQRVRVHRSFYNVEGESSSDAYVYRKRMAGA